MRLAAGERLRRLHGAPVGHVARRAQSMAMRADAGGPSRAGFVPGRVGGQGDQRLVGRQHPRLRRRHGRAHQDARRPRRHGHGAPRARLPPHQRLRRRQGPRLGAGRRLGRPAHPRGVPGRRRPVGAVSGVVRGGAGRRVVWAGGRGPAVRAAGVGPGDARAPADGAPARGAAGARPARDGGGRRVGRRRRAVGRGLGPRVSAARRRRSCTRAHPRSHQHWPPWVHVRWR
mmetsp:Transcript_20113/g.42199  ORF Transcript_20113/g.42199 Transcript_20113/m.42199 type:complete len:230 (-) Transcript_20113:124-813(-)